MDREKSNSIPDERLRVNPLIIGSFFIGIISVLSCFVPPVRIFSLPACIIIAALMAIYSIKKALSQNEWVIYYFFVRLRCSRSLIMINSHAFHTWLLMLNSFHASLYELRRTRSQF